MPADFERRVRARGGATRYRNIPLTKEKYLRVAVVRKPGARGGRTIAAVKRYGR